MTEPKKKPGAYCDAFGCKWRVRTTRIEVAFDELLKHEKESGHDRHSHGYMTGM